MGNWRERVSKKKIESGFPGFLERQILKEEEEQEEEEDEEGWRGS